MADGASIGYWLPDLILAFREAGGTARFPQIYRWIQMNRKQLPEEWQATVRATAYYHSSDSPVYKVGYPDVFFKKGHGLWALRHPSETITGKRDWDNWLDVIDGMSKEQIESYSGKQAEFAAYVNQQVEEKKRKFKIE